MCAVTVNTEACNNLNMDSNSLMLLHWHTLIIIKLGCFFNYAQPRLHIFDQTYSKNITIVKHYDNVKQPSIILRCFKTQFIPDPSEIILICLFGLFNEIKNIYNQHFMCLVHHLGLNTIHSRTAFS